jgi:hypothetical protein
LTTKGNARLGLNAVIVAVTDDAPRILTVSPTKPRAAAALRCALPFGPLDPLGHRTLERGLRSWVLDQSGLELGYVEQLYTFGDHGRAADTGRSRGPSVPRDVSVAYLALVHEATPGAGAGWRAVYDFLPWEDWRAGRPAVLDRDIASSLSVWARSPSRSQVAGGSDSVERSPRRRRERAEIAFGLAGAPWDPERVLERYELLYEAGLVAEAPHGASEAGLGVPLALDHRRILASALGRLRGKLRYRPLVFELLPASFTLSQLQQVVEALAGLRLHKQNFRRLVENAGLVEGTGKMLTSARGRPAELFRFRREVLRERAAPGVGLPGR